jgi:hypothetical protein
MAAPRARAYIVKQMRSCVVVTVVLACALASARARADCPTQAAACLLDEEGVALLAHKQYTEAAAKFEASITAGPSARAELGYAQALDALGKLGLAYDAIVEADRLSAWEKRDAPNDRDVYARGERIKYVMGDLRSRVGFVHVQLPAPLVGDPIVAVHREGHDVRDPHATIAIAPGDKVTAVLRSGARHEGLVKVAAGGETTWVVPVEAAAAVAAPPVCDSSSSTPEVGDGSAVPVTLPFESPGQTPDPTPDPTPPIVLQPPPRTHFGFEFALLPASAANAGSAIGGALFMGYDVAQRFRIGLRGGAFIHTPIDQTTSDEANTAMTHVTGDEFGGWLGVRAVIAGPLIATAELGAIKLDQTATLTISGFLPSTASNDLDYLVYTLGLGLHAGPLDFGFGLEGELTGLGESQPGTEPDLGVRLMITVGRDLFAW